MEIEVKTFSTKTDLDSLVREVSIIADYDQISRQCPSKSYPKISVDRTMWIGVIKILNYMKDESIRIPESIRLSMYDGVTNYVAKYDHLLGLSTISETVLSVAVREGVLNTIKIYLDKLGIQFTTDIKEGELVVTTKKKLTMEQLSELREMVDRKNFETEVFVPTGWDGKISIDLSGKA
jgi:hypothetical protein